MTLSRRQCSATDSGVFYLFIVIGILSIIISHAADNLPAFISKEGFHEILSGRTIHLPCQISNLGEYSVVWTKNGKESDKAIILERQVVNDNSRISIFVEDLENTENWDILINDAKPYDEGEYFCQISTTPIRLIQKQTLVVKVPPMVKIVPEQNPFTVRKGESFHLTCYASGNPQPEVLWVKMGDRLPNGRMSYDGETLYFDEANEKHEGIYKCTADNGVAQISSAEIKIQIIYPPVFNETTDPLIITKIGSPVTIKCSYAANPAPFVEWLFNGYPIEALLQTISDRVTVEKSHDLNASSGVTVLTVKNITFSDYGDYMCRISNNNGQIRSVTHVTGVPSIPLVEFAANQTKLIWRMESPEPLLAYRIEYKTPDEDFFQKIEFAYNDTTNATTSNSSNLYDGEVDLFFFDPYSIYDLILRGRNANGWGKSPPSFIRYKGEFFEHKSKRRPKEHSISDGYHKTNSAAICPKYFIYGSILILITCICCIIGIC